ncbi:MAG: ATP-binding cassette domain-containing protein [bacterium]
MLQKDIRIGLHITIILENIDLTVKEGDYVWLKGRSGSGKTTLLNLASGLDVPTEGDVSLLGVDVFIAVAPVSPGNYARASVTAPFQMENL